MTTYVVRDTFTPELDLSRNWSSFVGGSINGEATGSTEKEAVENYISQNGCEPENEYRYHNGLKAFAPVHYEGLGAFLLESENLDGAMLEALNFDGCLATTMGAGDGHFYADEVVSFHKVNEYRYIFELK